MRNIMGSGRRVVGVLSAFAVLVAAATAYGLINPNFTPLHLVEQSKLIMLLKFEKGQTGKITATIDKTLKGKTDEKTIVLDLTTTALKDHAKWLEQMISSPESKEPVHFFVGSFAEEGGEEMEAEGDEAEGQAFLHIGTKWFSFGKGDKNVWEFQEMDEKMLSCWHSSADMLLRCTQYVISDPDDAYIPVATEADWGDNYKAGTVKGRISSLQAVDLKGDGNKHLFVASDGGDALYVFDAKGKKFADVTSAAKLASKSVVAAWSDFNGDGLLDLLSWDGKALSKNLQGKDGTFKAVKVDIGDALKAGCVAMSVVDADKKGIPAVVASTTGVPVLLLPSEGDGMTARPLAAAAADKKLGKAGTCLVADFDGDLKPDVIQPFENGGLLFKGKGPADFEAPKATPVCLGPGYNESCIGDYDMNGALDILCATEQRPLLWHNWGNMKFTETFGYTGEPSYIAKPGGNGCATADINNDGRQDFAILYADRPVQIFFSRGFRSYGHSHSLDINDNDFLPEAADGHQAGCVADLTNDGAQDLAFAVKNGNIWVFLRDAEEALALSVALPISGVNAGPVTVTGWKEKRCLGAWNVVAGTQDGFFGVIDPGPVTIKWQLPGGKAQKKEIVIEEKPVRFVIK